MKSFCIFGFYQEAIRLSAQALHRGGASLAVAAL